MNGHHQGGGVALSLQPQQLSFPGGQDIKDPSLTAAAPFHVRSFVMVSRVEFDARADGRRANAGSGKISRNEKEMKARSVS